MNSKNVLFIIGNGFDIDLGLPTSYRDFVKSEYWPCHSPIPEMVDHLVYDTKCLHNYLNEQTTINSWYDLENILGKYACCPPGYHNGSFGQRTIQQAQADKLLYDNLVHSLTMYLKSTMLNKPNNDSVAARVLRQLLSQDFNLKIFSFNYTDLNILASELGIADKFKTIHVHGDLNNGIILGIERKLEFCPAYRYMCKEYNHNYTSTTLIHHLDTFNYIIIFGHSLSSIDYHYFQTFFHNQSRDILDMAKRKSITIFTYNEESAWDIRDQLSCMNNNRLDRLYANNDFRIIRTDGTDVVKVQKFLEDLSRFSSSNYWIDSAFADTIF